MDWGITAEDIHTLRETLRGSISMFGMLLAECEAGSETHKVISGAIRTPISTFFGDVARRVGG
jgi:hypothetical protein